MAERRTKLWMIVALAFCVAAIVAFVTYDANRPEALKEARQEAAAMSSDSGSDKRVEGVL